MLFLPCENFVLALENYYLDLQSTCLVLSDSGVPSLFLLCVLSIYMHLLVISQCPVYSMDFFKQLLCRFHIV
jgi:hypothetical protein